MNRPEFNRREVLISYICWTDGPDKEPIRRLVLMSEVSIEREDSYDGMIEVRLEVECAMCGQTHVIHKETI